MQTIAIELNSTSGHRHASLNEIALTLREKRVTEALLTSRDGIRREAIDRIAGASNGPSVISQIRRKLKLSKSDLETVFVCGQDRDGKTCRTGIYRLSLNARQKLDPLNLRGVDIHAMRLQLAHQDADELFERSTGNQVSGMRSQAAQQGFRLEHERPAEALSNQQAHPHRHWVDRSGVDPLPDGW